MGIHKILMHKECIGYRCFGNVWKLPLSSFLFFLFFLFPPISLSHLCASFTDIKINTVCVWLVHRMHRHYRIYRLRMCDPPPPTFAPTIIPHHTCSLCNPPFLHLSLSLRMHARTAAVAPCSRHGWGDESKCELLSERWRAWRWRIWRWVRRTAL